MQFNVHHFIVQTQQTHKIMCSKNVWIIRTDKLLGFADQFTDKTIKKNQISFDMVLKVHVFYWLRQTTHNWEVVGLSPLCGYFFQAPLKLSKYWPKIVENSNLALLHML